MNLQSQKSCGFCPKQARWLQILSLPVRSHLWCSVRIAIIAPTCHSCRGIILFWSRKKLWLRVLKLYNLNKSPTSLPLPCPLLPSLPNYASAGTTGSVIMCKKPSITIGYNNVSANAASCSLYSPSRLSSVLTSRIIYCVLLESVASLLHVCLLPLCRVMNVKGELNAEICS